MAEAQQGQPVKYTLTHYRRKEKTHEEFIKWMVEEHLPLAMPVFKRHGILSYSLFVTPASLNDALKQGIGKLRPIWDFADFDCFIEYILPDVGVIPKVMGDPEFQIKSGSSVNNIDVFMDSFHDKECTKILENIEKAMQRGYPHFSCKNRLFPAGANFRATRTDIAMMALNTAKERTVAQWDILLARAGFKIVKIFEVDRGFQSLIEAKLA